MLRLARGERRERAPAKRAIRERRFAARADVDDAAQPPKLKGSISLKRGSSMLDAAGETAFVVIDADGTKYPIKALSPDDKARWMAVLNRVIAGGRDFDEIFALARQIELEDGPAIQDSAPPQS